MSRLTMKRVEDLLVALRRRKGLPLEADIDFVGKTKDTYGQRNQRLPARAPQKTTPPLTIRTTGLVAVAMHAPGSALLSVPGSTPNAPIPKPKERT